MTSLQGHPSQACAAEDRQPAPRQIMSAMSTPLASIFGSGFLVIVPVLASAVGPYAVWAMLAVAFVAFHTGAIMRHNILCAEPVLAAGNKRATLLPERLSDVALVAAYVASVCLYIHILSAFVLGIFEVDSGFNKSLLTTLVIGLIAVIGLLGGLKPLECLERWALYVTILILALNSLIRLAAVVSVLLSAPLVIAAGLSQFSAAVADTLAAAANLEEVTSARVSQRGGYLPVGGAALALAWTGSTFTVIALASRAFALYYLLQCLVGLTVCRNDRERVRFFLVALALAFVLLFAVPAG